MNAQLRTPSDRPLGRVLLVWWFVPSLCVALLQGSCGAFYGVTTESTLFPGDPPAADLLLEAALAGWLFIFVGYCVYLWIRHDADRIVWLWRRILSPAVGASILLMLPVLTEVGRRHFGEWKPLKALIQDSESRVLELVRPKGERLSEEELLLAAAWFRDHPVNFTFDASRQTVRLRLMSPLPPYVGVDFGDGRNAVFDPVTMRCLYSD